MEKYFLYIEFLVLILFWNTVHSQFYDIDTFDCRNSGKDKKKQVLLYLFYFLIKFLLFRINVPVKMKPVQPVKMDSICSPKKEKKNKGVQMKIVKKRCLILLMRKNAKNAKKLTIIQTPKLCTAKNAPKVVQDAMKITQNLALFVKMMKFMQNNYSVKLKENVLKMLAMMGRFSVQKGV